MVLPGHIAGGYLAARAILSVAHLPLTDSQTIAIIVIGTLAGELPDMDLFLFVKAHKNDRGEKPESHRNYITHIPLFWLAVSLAIVSCSTLASFDFGIMAGWALLAGTWSHFILDSVEYGIKWLRPFSERRFCLREIIEPSINERVGSIRYYWKFLWGYYINTITFWCEITVTVTALSFILGLI